MNEMNEMSDLGRELSTRLTLTMCDRTINTELVGDYTLPDYQAEIRRVLNVVPTVLPPAKYVGSTAAELNGTVDYSVLYVGADGGLYTVPLSSEYNLSLPMERVSDVDLGEGITLLCDSVAESVSARVTAPRRISLRCRLRSHVRAFGTMTLEERCYGDVNPESVRRQKKEARRMTVRAGLSDVIGMSEEIGGMGEDVRVISAEAVPFVREVRGGASEVDASGEILLKLLLGYEDGSTESVMRKLPFEGSVELDGMGEVPHCRVTGMVSDLSVEVGEGKILCDVGLLLEARGMVNQTVSYTSDLYSTERESTCETQKYSLPMILRCDHGNISQNERVPKETLNWTDGTTLKDVFAGVRFDTCEQAGQKYVLIGQSRYVLLCENNGEYSTTEVLLPLRYETEGGEMAPESFDAVGTVISCHAKIEGATLQLNAEIAIASDFMGSKEILAVTDARFGEPLDCRGNRMTVYYPSAEESAWEVAKKYHVSADRISESASYYFF